jgi:tetratricopeptide (TPR) repeat protein
MADAQNMMGRIDEAHSSLKVALELDPDNLEAYYQLVQVCKEKGCWRSSEEWGEVVAEMEGALLRSKGALHNAGPVGSSTKGSHMGEESEDDYYDDYSEDEESALPTRDLAAAPPSLSIYWALFEACQKKGAELTAPLVTPKNCENACILLFIIVFCVYRCMCDNWQHCGPRRLEDGLALPLHCTHRGNCQTQVFGRQRSGAHG